jgi:P27 family predicted phage terminase small subunit
MTKPKSPSPPPRPPAYLSADAARIWRGVVTHLRGNGLLLRVDVGVIETYCMAVVRQRRLTAELDKAGMLDESGKPHPLLRTIEATAATVKNLAHVLGLSPMSRKALPAKPENPKGADPWSGVLER